MEFGGKYAFAAPRLTVWAALNDAQILKAAIPGCERIEWTGPSELDLKIAVNLGIARPVFGGVLELSKIVPAESYRLSGHGKGGFLGQAHGSADVGLWDIEGGTALEFEALGGASGRLAALGKTLIGNSAQAVIDGFFERIGAAMAVDVKPLPRD